ncbi:MAG: S8 family serine peptidase [Gemmobacter sp.]|uniref:S8 family serine peptidase n=1 Tax=Gemmobacter sp. TaxID=1898957 RepID=UPI001A4261E2|nr:S8 family serine peptidase [Gemmobacter sp.]MBL8563916.1 S8 family serine peptidase [Gemmobacter sp.]
MRLRAALALALALLAPPALARDCVAPGDVVNAPLRTVLQAGLEVDDLNLRLDFDGITMPVKILAQSRNRLRVRMPLRGVPGDTLFWLRHIPKGGGRDIILTQGRTCPRDGPMAAPQRGPRRPLERATASDVAAPSGAPEYLLAGRSAAMGAAEALLAEAGAEVLRRTELGGLGLKMLAVDLRGTMTLNQLRGALARRGVAAKADRHTVYRAAAGPDSKTADASGYALQMVGQRPDAVCALGRQVRIGLIDGPVDTGVPALAGVPVRSTSVLSGGDHQGSADHATGIAALIASPGGSGAPPGIAPGAQIYSVVAFARTGGREVARLENIAQALDWLIESRVELINMSLTGPENETLAELIRLADARGIVMLAATGNGGREGVAYPAADPRVIGVTAVDAARRLYRKANTGPGVDFAAPGVDVLVPGRGGKASYRSGTSYASAVATAVVAQMMARGTRSREGLLSALGAAAEDLGAPGVDTQFGRGLIRLPGGC